MERVKAPSELVIVVSEGILYSSRFNSHYYRYGIHINTNDPAFSLNRSHIWRRYSEFYWIRKILQRNYYMHQEIQLPSLPTQGLFKNRSDPKFLEDRRAGLETFIHSLMEIPLLKADRALHMFLQTNFSTTQIESKLKREQHDPVLHPYKGVPSTEGPSTTVLRKTDALPREKSSSPSSSLDSSQTSIRSALKSEKQCSSSSVTKRNGNLSSQMASKEIHSLGVTITMS